MNRSQGAGNRDSFGSTVARLWRGHSNPRESRHSSTRVGATCGSSGALLAPAAVSRSADPGPVCAMADARGSNKRGCAPRSQGCCCYASFPAAGQPRGSCHQSNAPREELLSMSLAVPAMCGRNSREELCNTPGGSSTRPLGHRLPGQLDVLRRRPILPVLREAAANATLGIEFLWALPINWVRSARVALPLSDSPRHRARPPLDRPPGLRWSVRTQSCRPEPRS